MRSQIADGLEVLAQKSLDFKHIISLNVSQHNVPVDYNKGIVDVSETGDVALISLVLLSLMVVSSCTASTCSVLLSFIVSNT